LTYIKADDFLDLSSFSLAVEFSAWFRVAHDFVFAWASIPCSALVGIACRAGCPA
jgi:hypothetical protein